MDKERLRVIANNAEELQFAVFKLNGLAVVLDAALEDDLHDKTSFCGAGQLLAEMTHEIMQNSEALTDSLFALLKTQ